MNSRHNSVHFKYYSTTVSILAAKYSHYVDIKKYFKRPQQLNLFRTNDLAHLGNEPNGKCS